MCCSLFAGCSLIEHNDEKDMRQVVAVIKPIEDESNGISFSSEEKRIYKRDLVYAVNQYASTYISNYGFTLEEATDTILNELVTRELLLIEAQRLLEQKYIEWTQADTNNYNRYIYSAIDSQLNSIKSDIAASFGETLPSTGDDETTETTFPVPDDETTEDDYSDYELDENNRPIQDKDSEGNLLFDDDGNPVYKYKVWTHPDEKDWPCMWGDEKEQSRDREAIRNFIEFLRTSVENDFKVTEDDKRKFAEDDKNIDNTINTQGIQYVYPMLGTTHYLEYIAGQTARQSILITKLQDYILDGVTVTDEEIADAYQKQLAYQKAAWANNQEAYQTALSGGKVTMLYMRDASYFFVKHILLPFSDEQTAAMNAYKNNPQNAGKDYTVFRDNQLVFDTVVYPHESGEYDMSRKYTVEQVFAEIKSAMAPLKNNPAEAERKFDELTYKYNTDDGAFGYGKSYAVKINDEEDHSGYMEEFYYGAMELYKDYEVGQVLPHYVVTDYGVHIMYLSQKIEVGDRLLSSPLTPAGYSTVRDTIESTIRTTKENSAFTTWQNERITYYQESAGVVTTYKKRYKSLYEN